MLWEKELIPGFKVVKHGGMAAEEDDAEYAGKYETTYEARGSTKCSPEMAVGPFGCDVPLSCFLLFLRLSWRVPHHRPHLHPQPLPDWQSRVPPR